VSISARTAGRLLCTRSRVGCLARLPACTGCRMWSGRCVSRGVGVGADAHLAWIVDVDHRTNK